MRASGDIANVRALSYYKIPRGSYMHRLSFFTLFKFALAVAALLAISACGGGSGDDENASSSSGNNSSSTGNSSAGTNDGIIMLTDGQVRTASGTQGARQIYSILVPEGTKYLQVKTWGGSGDVDIGVRHGHLPSTFDNDCDSNEDGVEEYCEIVDPEGGIWYIELHAYTAYSGVSLRANLADYSCAWDNNPGCDGYVPLPALFSLAVSPSVSIPRGNSGDITVTVTRHAEMITGMVTLQFEDLPYGVFLSHGEIFVTADQTQTTLTFVAQSDTPDGIHNAKVVGTAIGSGDVKADFTILPEMMVRDPENTTECEAHWYPLIGQVTGPQGLVDGWKAVSLRRNGIDEPIPGTRYKEWYVAFETQVVNGRRVRLNEVREVVLHMEGNTQHDFDLKSVNGYLSTPTMLNVYSNGCGLSTGIERPGTLHSNIDRRSWTLVSHRPGGALSEQLVLQGYGTETTYSKPIYEITFERAILPAEE
jgi:hypothetical protein